MAYATNGKSLICISCKWVGYRIYREAEDGYGCCPKCKGKIILRSIQKNDKRLNKAKEDYEKINSNSDRITSIST